MRKLWAFGFVALLALAGVVSADDSTAMPLAVTVHVFTAPPAGGVVADPDYTRRADAVASIKAGFRRGDDVEVVEARERADVLIEVTYSDYSRSRTGVKVTAGDLETKIERASRGMIGGGGIGARDWVGKKIGDEAEKWIANNRAAILAKREARQ